MFPDQPYLKSCTSCASIAMCLDMHLGRLDHMKNDTCLDHCLLHLLPAARSSQTLFANQDSEVGVVESFFVVSRASQEACELPRRGIKS